jgi:hypothetical protein
LKRLPFALLLVLSCTYLSAQFTLDFSYGKPYTFDDLNVDQLAPGKGQSFIAGLKYVPGKLGFGVQYGWHDYSTNRDYLDAISVIAGSGSDGGETNWRTGLLAIGPVFRLGSSKLNIEAFPKFGLASIQPPDQRIVIRDGIQETLLYQENHQEADLVGSNLFYGIDGRVNFGITDAVGLSVSLGYNTNAGLGEGPSVIYRDLGLVGPNTTSEEVRRSRLLRHDCDGYSLLTASVGVTISFGKKKKKPPREEDPSERMLPPAPRTPEDEAVIAVEDAKELQLEWSPETPEVVRANYLVFLYERKENSDSLIFSGKTERELQLILPENLELREGVTYRWRVRAVDDRRLAPCPDDCYSVDYEFTIDALGLPQFYQLLDRNVGGPVPTGSTLRILVDPGMFYADEVRVLISDERNEVVLESATGDGMAEWLEALADGRFAMDLRSLELDRQYTLKVTNGKRSQYLRFIQPRKQQQDEGQ